jgi:hypothetical protein
LLASPALVRAATVRFCENESSVSANSSMRRLYGSATASKTIAIANHTKDCVLSSPFRLIPALQAGHHASVKLNLRNVRCDLRALHPLMRNPSTPSIRKRTTSEPTTPAKNIDPGG